MWWRPAPRRGRWRRKKGDSLFLVNYRDGTGSKVRTSDMALLQTNFSGRQPVGITFDADARQVWVATTPARSESSRPLTES